MITRVFAEKEELSKKFFFSNYRAFQELKILGDIELVTFYENFNI
jgi:hypothetical protein